MAFWNKKKIDSRLIQFFNDKNISYEVESGDTQKFKFELCFQEQGYVLYPYITVDDATISFNINVNQQALKGYSYEQLNAFNQNSKFFKAYITITGIVCLEYRFQSEDEISSILDTLIESLFSMAEEIDKL